MARHQLIAVQLDTLRTRLPEAAVAELADGLDETFDALLAQYGNPDTAAAATIEEFGDADTITAAFFRDSPFRRLATLLLATGPVMGLVWGVALIGQRAWNWPVPLPVRTLYGTALITVVAILIIVIRERHAYRRTRLTTTGCAVGLIILDSLMIGTIATLATVPAWTVAIAVAASLIRVVGILRALPAALSE
jgi:hypothetical protein